MILRICYFIAFIFIIQVSTSYPNELKHLNLIINTVSSNLEHTDSYRKSLENKPSTSIFTKAVIFYQRYISIQDMRVCNFKPSCSQFGYLSLTRYGSFWGILMINDRLLRDNPSVFRNYQIDKENHLVNDKPVYLYYLPYYSD
ncbi:MAG: membrane protein insertion efficiency factor YidD [Candidatus Marinimicrobia bacterium]|nr:membrane protein insertion efficiency factor YidD [Candidatus Neomarinimicrobiota bacterium]